MITKLYQKLIERLVRWELKRNGVDIDDGKDE